MKTFEEESSDKTEILSQDLHLKKEINQFSYIDFSKEIFNKPTHIINHGNNSEQENLLRKLGVDTNELMKFFYYQKIIDSFQKSSISDNSNTNNLKFHCKAEPLNENHEEIAPSAENYTENKSNKGKINISNKEPSQKEKEKVNTFEEDKNSSLCSSDKFSQLPQNNTNNNKNNINNTNNTNNINPPNISPNEKTTIRSDIFKIFQGLFYIAADAIRSEKLEAELFVLTFNSKIFSYFYQLMPMVDFSALKIRSIDRFSNLLAFLQEQRKPILILAGWVQFNEEIDSKRSLHTLNYFANNDLFGSDSVGNNQDIFYFHYNKVNQLRKMQYFENSAVPFMFLDILKVNFSNCLIFMICRYESNNNLEDDHIENRVRPPYRIKKKFVQKILLPIERFNFEKKNNLSHYTVFPLPEKTHIPKTLPQNNEKTPNANQIPPISQQKKEKQNQNSSIDSAKNNNSNENLERILQDIKSICLKKILFLEEDLYRTKNMDLIAKDLQMKKQEIQNVCKYLSISLLDEIKVLTQNANKSTSFDNNPRKLVEKEEGEVETESKESKEYFLYTKNDQENHLLIEELNSKTLNVLRMSLPKLISIEFKLKKKNMEYIECHKNIFEEFMIFLKQAHLLVNLKFNFSKSATDNEWGCSIADLLYDLPNIKSLSLDFSTTNFNDYTFFLIVQSLKKMNNLFFLDISCNEVNLTDDSAENLRKSLDNEDFWNKLKEGAISLRNVKISQENLDKLHSIFKEKFKRIKFFS